MSEIAIDIYFDIKKELLQLYMLLFIQFHASKSISSSPMYSWPCISYYIIYVYF